MEEHKKLISVRIAVFNELENISILVDRITKVFEEKLPKYNYEIIFSDNKSTDGTRSWIRQAAKESTRIKAIFNTQNMRNGSGRNLLKIQSGDCCIVMAGDLQDPPELIEEFVHYWEEGYKIVIGVKPQSEENRFMFRIRNLYYKIIAKISRFDQIRQATGFGLYDRKWMDFFRKIEDPCLTYRGIVAQYGFERKEVEYIQPKRLYGESKNNFFSLYAIAMRAITASSDIPLRFATFLGLLSGTISIILGIVYFFLKLTHWNTFDAGIAPIIILITMLGGAILLCIGILGEYILTINKRLMNYPDVLEEERINFGD